MSNIYRCTVTVSKDYTTLVEAEDEWEAKDIAKRSVLQNYKSDEAIYPTSLDYVSETTAMRADENMVPKRVRGHLRVF